MMGDTEDVDGMQEAANDALDVVEAFNIFGGRSARDIHCHCYECLQEALSNLQFYCSFTPMTLKHTPEEKKGAD